jgi:hypothetical protein
MGQQGLDLRGVGQEAAVPIVVQRLLAEPVAGDEEFAGLLVPDGEGEHPAQAGDALRTVLLIGVKDGFGIGAGGVAMAGLFQIGTKIRVVEDFAVESDPEGLVLVGHWLVAA